VSLGHPVRSFVLALLAVGAVLLALQWTGFVHPDIEATGEGTQVLGDGAVTVTVTIQNRSALSVEVVGVEWPTTASTDAAPGIAPYVETPDGAIVSYALEPFEPFTLDHDETAWLGLRLGGCGTSFEPPSLRVKTASGLHRTIELDSPTPGQPVGCP
jgi:hypothetical protein